MNTYTVTDRTRFLTPDVAFNPYHALTSYERAEADQAFAIAEGIVTAYDATVGFLRQYVAAPLVRLHLRNRLVEELSQLSDRSLSDIGMSRRDIIAAARKAYPLFDSAEEVDLSAASVRTVATAAQRATPANDDSNRQAA